MQRGNHRGHMCAITPPQQAVLSTLRERQVRGVCHVRHRSEGDVRSPCTVVQLTSLHRASWSLAAQALLVHGNSCPLATIAPWCAGSWQQMLHHIGSDNPCRHSFSKRSAPGEFQGWTLALAGCRASSLIMSYLRSPRQLLLHPYTNEQGDRNPTNARKKLESDTPGFGQTRAPSPT